MRDLTVVSIGNDRPGIVAAVTEVLYRLGCNLADCSMTRLSEQFAMILLVQAPPDVTKERLQQDLETAADRLGLRIQIYEAPHASAPEPKNPYVISLYGADHPGIVYRVTSELASRGANITDLVSRVVGDNVFTMVLDVDLPPSLKEAELQGRLKDLAGELGVDLTLRAAGTADL